MSVQVAPRGTRGYKFPAGLAVRIFTAVGRLGYRLSSAKGLVLLTTKGAKSGQERSTVVTRFEEDSESVLVIGSKGGAATHPAWFLNIAKNPDSVWIDVKGRRVKVLPESLHGEERARAWERIVKQSPQFGDYEQKTDREIPVVRLTPLEDEDRRAA